MSAHTPGPWVAVFDMDERGAEVETAPRSLAEGSRGICNCSPEDALLIAAAPDLAEALRDMIDEWLRADKGTALGMERCIRARAALVKAGL